MVVKIVMLKAGTTTGLILLIGYLRFVTSEVEESY